MTRFLKKLIVTDVSIRNHSNPQLQIHSERLHDSYSHPEEGDDESA